MPRSRSPPSWKWSGADARRARRARAATCWARRTSSRTPAPCELPPALQRTLERAHRRRPAGRRVRRGAGAAPERSRHAAAAAARAAGADRARGAAPLRRRRDDRVHARAERRPQADLGRRPPDGDGGRARRRRSRRRGRHRGARPSRRHEPASPHAAESNTIFCRITPDQKKALVGGPRGAGAVHGDDRRRRQRRPGAQAGPAGRRDGLRQPDHQGDRGHRPAPRPVLDAARAPSQEGRRIARNIHRLGRLYATKTIYAGILILLTAIFGFAFPFLPRQLTVAALLTIGIPSFVLALAPSEGPLYRGRLLRALAAFAVPAGAGSPWAPCSATSSSTTSSAARWRRRERLRPRP